MKSIFPSQPDIFSITNHPFHPPSFQKHILLYMKKKKNTILLRHRGGEGGLRALVDSDDDVIFLLAMAPLI